MISENSLRVAAARASELYVARLERGYDPTNQHPFSAEFEKKIKKLKRKADHPFIYRTMQRVASIALAILIAGGAYLTVNVEARAAFFGWVKEIYETYFVYRFEEPSSTGKDPASFRPTWLPEGYTEFYVDDTEGTTVIVYADENGHMLKLSYAHNPNETDWFIKTEQVDITPAMVNDNPAELLISSDPETANAILWTTSDNTAFYLSAFLDESDLIKVAESIQIEE